ncbi:MAG: ABC transporter substrate-binding protein, partial [Gemmatimonadales bacterium]
MRRVLALLSLLGTGWVACGGGGGREDGAAPLILGYTADLQTLNPLVSTDQNANDLIYHLLYTPLVTYDSTYRVRPWLAESWEFEGKSVVFTLRDDVRWHDGEPVTAHDVKFTVDLLNHPEVLYPANGIESVEVLDDTTFIMTYKPGSAWHAYWYPGYWERFYPKHLLEHLDPAEFYTWDFWTDPVGNGPFRYVRRTPGIMVEFEANPDFYLGKPKIDRVVIKFGPESITELVAGNIDALNVENRTSVLGIEDDP